MGLDMYLYCNSKRVCEDANRGCEDADFNVPRGIAVYWRKANAIHRWFVDHVQCGEDDCGRYEVGITQLAELHDTCKEVLESTRLVDAKIQNGTINGKPNMVDGKKLEDTSTAKRLLPTCDGFFYGSTDYDQYYLCDLEHTVESLEMLMENLEPTGDWLSRVMHKDEPGWFVELAYKSSW